MVAEGRSGTGLATSAGCSPRDFRSRLAQARLPTMPQILLRLLDLCHREEASLADLATLINRDAGMAARVFAVTTSAAFHGRARPATLEQCLTLLGMNAIKTIVINESVMQVFNRFTTGRDIDLSRFWGHSLRCALLARELAKKMAYGSPEEAYLGGLVHDVGQLAILATDPDGYGRMFVEFDDNEVLCARELEIFSLTHAEVGAWLVEKWELDSFIGDSVLYHHEPADRVASAHPLVRIVQLANRLAASCGREPSAEVADMVARYGASIPDLGGLLEAVEVELVTAAEQLGIRLAPPGPVEAPAASDEGESLQLASRIQDILLVDRVLTDAVKVDSREAAHQGIVQAAKILFDVDAALWFEPDARGERFQAKPLGARWSRVTQLEFVRGRSDSALARAIDRGPQILRRATAGGSVLDDQIQRLLGGDGVLFLPLRSRRGCAGVLAIGIDGAPRAARFTERIPCLDYFGRVSADLLAGFGDKAAAVPPAPEPQQHRLNSLVHEISNPLSIIRNYLHILESECADKDVGQPQIGIVREEIDRVAKILHSVRQQDKAGSAPGPVQLNRVIEDLVILCRGSVAMTGGIELRLDLANDLPEIASDGDQLKQLLLNLLKNSIEAMPGGGTVRITTAPWGSGSGPSHAEICIEDTGPGIPREVLSRLYQPVASSKGGEHQGLGLAIVGQLVRQLRGLINCRSSEQGTRFQVLLPFNGK